MILRRYVLQRVASRTLFVLLAGLLLYLIIDVMGISQHLSRGSVGQVLRLYLLRLPEMAVALLPVAVVLGPMLAMGSLAKRFELAALKFLGGTMRRLVVPPLLVTATAAALLLIGVSEWVLPVTAPKVVALQAGVFKLRGPRFWSYYLPRRWMRTPQGFLHTGSMRDGKPRELTYLAHDERFVPTLLIHADRLERDGDGYSLVDGQARALQQPDAAVEHFARRRFPEPLDPGALAQHLGYPEVFGLATLWRVAGVRSSQGGPVTPFLLALWRRLGDPLLLLALVLLVAPLASWSKRGQPTERRLIEGAVIIGYYFICRGLFGTLAEASHPSCAAAALGPTLLTLVLAALLWRRLEAEQGLG